MTTEAIAGYAYGNVPPSPVSPAQFDDLRSAVGLDDGDHAALHDLWAVLDGDLERLFESFIARIGHFFAPTFGAADGAIDEAYMAAAHPRFLKWIEDTCLRPCDQAWVDYQPEIALRHYRTKKNRTDGASAVEIVPFRYLPVTVAPMVLALREFLGGRGVEGAEAARMLDAWMKSLLLQVTLWSRAYVNDADW